MTSSAVVALDVVADVSVRFTQLRSSDRVERREEARAWLRSQLAARLGVNAGELAFTRRCGRCGASHGRPELAGRFMGAARFSLSHSEDHAALAVTTTERVGLDIEAIRPARFLLETLSPGELERCRERTPSDEELIRLWVRKEALLKVSGLGLAHPPNRLTVDGDTSWCAVPADDGRFLRCGVADVDAPAGLLSAVALEGAVPCPTLTDRCATEPRCEIGSR